MISARGLSKRYGATVALDAIDFHVARGEVVGLLGPNGAGKTTCMRILTGYVAASEGEVRVADIDVERDSLRARAHIGYLPEGVPLYPELRVQEYLRFRARLRKITRKQRDPEIDRVSRLCGVQSVQRRIIGQLSRGYRQRVGLADAMLGSPDVLVLDEPTAGLDPNQMREVRHLIKAVSGDQTVLLSTHILSEVEAVCDRVLIVDRGRIVAQGPVAEVCRGHDTGSVTLELRGPAAEIEGRLRELDVVDTVTVEVGETAETVETSEAAALDMPALRCRLSGRFDGPAMERLSRLAADSGWALRELRRDRGQLEDVFARLTAGQAGGGP